jgi:hypothetical protein
MPEQLEFVDGFQSPHCDRARAKNAPPAPDADGFFDFSGVIEIACGRGCIVGKTSDFAANVWKSPAQADPKNKGATLTAIAPGQWEPAAILRACSAASGRKTPTVDRSARPTNPGGLDELKIATIVAADGLRPYLHKSGGPTWAFRAVLLSASPDQVNTSYDWRRAVRALEDVGLLSIKLGPRGGFTTAALTWTPRAYIAPVVRTALTHEEERFFDELAGNDVSVF